MVGFEGDPSSHVSVYELGLEDDEYCRENSFRLANEDTMNVFGELMDKPKDRLEPSREGTIATDGGNTEQGYGENELYSTVSAEEQTMKDVNHNRSGVPDPTV